MAKVDEVLETIRDGIETHRWIDYVPTAARLATELGEHRKAIRDALEILVSDGTLLRVGNTYKIGGDPVSEGLTVELQRRATLIMGLYGTTVTADSLAGMDAEDRATLLDGYTNAPYDMLDLAVTTFCGHTADAVRSALGWRDTTSQQRTATGRRRALAEEIHVDPAHLAGLERAGSIILAGHIESVVDMHRQGLLRLEAEDHPPSPHAILETVQDLQVRLRALERARR